MLLCRILINNKKCHKSILNWTYFWSASLRVFLCLRFHIPMSVLLVFCHLYLASKTPMASDCLLRFCGLVELFDLMMNSSLRTDGSLVDHCSGCYNALSLVWAFQLSQRIQRINPPFLSASCTVSSCQHLAHTWFLGPVNQQSHWDHHQNNHDNCAPSYHRHSDHCFSAKMSSALLIRLVFLILLSLLLAPLWSCRAADL